MKPLGEIEIPVRGLLLAPDHEPRWIQLEIPFTRLRVPMSGPLAFHPQPLSIHAQNYVVRDYDLRAKTPAGTFVYRPVDR